MSTQAGCAGLTADRCTRKRMLAWTGKSWAGTGAVFSSLNNQSVESARRLAQRLRQGGLENLVCQVVLDAFTKKVVKSLARYWCDNPFACDTAEGIRQWWLAPTDDVSVEQVNRALASLCDCGIVERLLAADGRARFRRTSGHDDAALRQLAEFGEQGEVGSREMH